MEAAIVQHDVTEADVIQHEITVDEFDQMVEAGVFAGQHVELIDGRLMDMPPMEPPHTGTVLAFDKIVQAALGRRALVRPQTSLPVSRISQPEPDLALVRWDEGYYRDHHPRPEETFAVVEVSYTTLAFDREVKRRVYGAARIPEYWIVDVRKKRIHVHREPHDLGYGAEEVRERDDAVSFAAFPDVVLSVADLVG